jgi:hypothetical protein
VGLAREATFRSNDQFREAVMSREMQDIQELEGKLQRKWVQQRPESVRCLLQAYINQCFVHVCCASMLSSCVSSCWNQHCRSGWAMHWCMWGLQLHNPASASLRLYFVVCAMFGGAGWTTQS